MTSFAHHQHNNNHHHHYLSHHTKKALVKGIIATGAVTVIYLVVVIATTPSLFPVAAVNAAFTINSIIIIGTSVGVGVQIFIASYSKSIGCLLDTNKKKNKNRKASIGAAGSGTTTAVSSFFSFFSLVPLGCCGSWLLILSLLPSVFGSSLSVLLIQYSKPLSYIGLAIVFGFAGLSAFKLQRELKKMEKGKKVKERSKGED
jgi:hypothetical protein